MLNSLLPNISKHTLPAVVDWFLRNKAEKGERDQSLCGEQRDCQRVCLCININCKHLKAVGDAPAVVLTVDACLWESMNIYQCKMGAISLTQYRLRWPLRCYLVLVAPFALEQVQSPCVLLTHCHYWRTSHRLPVAKAAVALKMVA